MALSYDEIREILDENIQNYARSHGYGKDIAQLVQARILLDSFELQKQVALKAIDSEGNMDDIRQFLTERDVTI